MCLLAHPPPPKKKKGTQLATESEMLICPNIHKRKRHKQETKRILAADRYAKQALSVEMASLHGYDG